MIRKTGIYYYCNLASPSLYDGEAIKNIDYDLDVKLFPDGRIEILDEDEYEQHGREMGYSEPLKHAVEKRNGRADRQDQTKRITIQSKGN